jgi:lipoprotein
MKNKLIKILISIFLLAGLLVGCNQNSKEKDIVGRYILTRIEKDKTAILEDEIKNSDVTGFIIFNEDGTGTFMMLNDRLPFTWKDGKITGGDQTISYELDGDKLTLIISATEKIYLQKE